MPPIAQYVFNGIVTGGTRALPTVAFSLLWRLLRFPNFAVSTYLTIGAYAALALNAGARAPLEAAWLGALLATGGVALAVDRIAFRPMRDRRPFSLAIASIGAAFVLENVVRFVWGNDFRACDVPVTRAASVAGLRIGNEQLLILGVTVVLMALAQAFLLRTRLGVAMRATADNPLLAAVKGVPTDRVIAAATFGGGALAGGAGVAGLAGVLFAHYLAYVEPNMFLPQESLYVWLALILGGSGNNRGALLGSLVLLGLLEGSRFTKDVIPFLTGVRLAAAQQILVGVVLVVLMIRRPEGLPERPGSK